MLIESKFFVPPLRFDHVERLPLVEYAKEGLHRRLTLIVAPAGYGKSSCSAELLHHLEGPCCWIGLDPSDDEPIRFWAHVGHALIKIFDGLGGSATAALSTPRPPSIRGVLSAWLNELSALDRKSIPGSRGVLVLDDAHLLENPELLRTLAFFIDHLPPSLHLVLTARRPPELPFHRWRSRAELSEIGVELLRFDREETRRFLERREIRPSAREVTALHEKTEGWGAALQLALASSAGRTELPLADFPRVTAGPHPSGIDGSVLHIADFFAEEVLGGFGDDLRDFLLRISILDTFGPSLARAVTGRADAEALFEKLERLHLPIIRLDTQGRWWRFHWLFRDFLKRRLEIENPEQASEGRRLASLWLEQNGFVEPAFHLALAAGEPERAHRLLREQARQLMAKGEGLVLIRAVRDLGSAWDALDPELQLQLTWAFFITHDNANCRRAVRVAEANRDKGLLDRRLLALLESIHGALARSGGRLSASKEHFRSALDNARAEDPQLIGDIALQLGLSHIFAYEIRDASQAFELCLESLDPHPADSLTRVGAISTLAQIRIEEGLVELAESTCIEALDSLPDASPPSSLIHRTLGRIHLARGSWDEARDAFELSAVLARRVGYDELVALTELWRAELERICCRTDGLDDALRRMEALGPPEQFPPLQRNWSRALRTHQALDEGNLEAAERLARSGPNSGGDSNMAAFKWQLACLRLAATGGRFGEARELSSTLLDACRRQGRIEGELECLVWRSWVEHRSGTVPAALEALEQASSLARGARFVGPFATLPRADAVALLERLLARRRLPEATALHGSHVLDALGRASPPRATALAGPALTERELEVLRLLARGLDNRRIADEMGVAATTVKTHLRNLFAKLEVRRRTQAVARARELALL